MFEQKIPRIFQVETVQERSGPCTQDKYLQAETVHSINIFLPVKNWQSLVFPPEMKNGMVNFSKKGHLSVRQGIR